MIIMKIIFYCQYVWGMGHLFRSAEFVRALSGHRVVLVAGGQEVDMNWPEHVEVLRLPTLYMDEKFTTLIAGDSERRVEDIQHQRKTMLFDLFESLRPDVFIVELYPFGRRAFGVELKPLLDATRQGKFGRVKTVCSLRDILVEKKDPRAYEKKVIDSLERYFDLLLIHSDETLLPLDQTFSRIKEIPIPLYYTGFIAQQGNSADGAKLRKELEIGAEEKLMVASAGGGRSGYHPLKSVLQACDLLGDQAKLRLEVFTGPFMAPEEFDDLCRLSKPGMRMQRFTQRFLDYLFAADLSFSLAGYNTCMNLLATRVPALVYPYHKQREQPMRVETLKNLLPLKMLHDRDLEPEVLIRHIEEMISKPPSFESASVNLNGAQNAARFLKEWIQENDKSD
jgi:predicted glycosyltransferase